MPKPDGADGLEQRVERVEADVAKLRFRVKTMQMVVGALQADQARTLGLWERKLARAEAGQVGKGGLRSRCPRPSVKGAVEGVRERPQVKPPGRPYPAAVLPLGIAAGGGWRLVWFLLAASAASGTSTSEDRLAEPAFSSSTTIFLAWASREVIAVVPVGGKAVPVQFPLHG